MKALLNNDICYSTVNNVFNSDHQKRDFIDPTEAAKAFDFEIEKHHSYTNDGRIIDRQWHLRRNDDDSIIPSRGLGDEFQPVQHKQVFDYIVNDIMPQIPEMTLETVGTLHGGGTGMIMAKFGENYKIAGDNSPQESRLFFFNPNGKSSLTVGFTNVRLFCQNQIAAACSTASGSGFRVWHTTNADMKVDEAIKSIYDSVGATRHIQFRQEHLADVGVTMDNLNHLLDKLLPLTAFEPDSKGWNRMNNQRIEVIRQFTDGETAQTMEGDTAWKLFNSFTYPIYNPISIGKTTDLAQITYAGTVGTRADRVTRILDAVEEEVGLAA